MSYGLVFGNGFNGDYVNGLSIIGEFIYLTGGFVRCGHEPVGAQFDFSELKMPVDGREIIVAYVDHPPTEHEIMRAYKEAKEAFPHHFN